MDFAKKLKVTLVKFCQTLETESPLLQESFRKAVTFDLVGFYVINLEFLFKNNIETIKTASVLHRPKTIAGFFEHKWEEEKGHDEWARNDLKRLMQENRIKKKPYVLNEMKELIAFLSKTMRDEPYHYVAYFYYAEFMTAYLGPQWMNVLHAALGVESKDITALSRHIELDDNHADEVLEYLISQGFSVEDEARLHAFLNKLHSYYERFFYSLAQTGVQDEETCLESTYKLPSAS